MNTIKTSFLGLVFTALFLLSACGGGEESAPTNVTPTKVSGVWAINEKSDERDCGNTALVTDNYTVTVTQDGDNITVVTQADTFSGSVNGATVSWTGAYFDAAENGWVTITSMELTFNANTLSGTSTWEFRNTQAGEVICTGTTQISGTLNPEVGESPVTPTTPTTPTTPVAPATPVKPVAPSNLSGLAVGESAIRINWSDNANNESNYKIEQSLKEFSGFAQIATLGVSATSYLASGLSPSTRYFFRVRATNSVGDSAYSNTINVITNQPEITIPVRPTGLSAIAVGNSITLNWTDNSANESFYKIERSLSPSSGFTEIASLGLNSNRYVNTNLSAGTRYHYRVRATNSTGASAYSNTALAVTEQTPMSPPVLSSPSPITGPPIVLRWTQDWCCGLVTTNDGFQVQQSVTSPTSGFVEIWSSINTGVGDTATTKTLDVTVAPPGTTHYFRVRARKSGIFTDWSNVVTVTVLAPTNTTLSWTPGADNTILHSTADTGPENTVSGAAELSVGCQYMKTLAGNESLCFASTIWFDIIAEIAGKTINSATLKLYPAILPADRINPFEVHAITSTWSTRTLTWKNSPQAFNTPFSSFNPPSTTAFPVVIDVASMVRKWADGSWFNQGFMIWTTGVHPGVISLQGTSFCSREWFQACNGKKPELIVNFQ